MTAPAQAQQTAIPDLRDRSLDEIAEDGTGALAHAVALYRERLRETGVTLSSFQARI